MNLRKWDLVDPEKTAQLARKLHADARGEQPAIPEWDDLTDEMRDWWFDHAATTPGQRRGQ